MAAKRKRRTWRLMCEALEDRTAPAVVTQRLLDINQNTNDGVPLSASSRYGWPYPYSWKEFHGDVYFEANNQPPGYDDPGPELWKTDGTVAGTVLVKDIKPGFYGSYPIQFAISNDTLFFTADDGTAGVELWKTDGTASGTVTVKNINPETGNLQGHSSWPHSLTDFKGALFFIANDGTHTGLWRSDGTATGTLKVKDFLPPANYSVTAIDSDLVQLNGVLYFTAVDGAAGRALWKSDGTTAGTVLLTDVDPSSTSSKISDLTAVGNSLFFVHSDAINGSELWTSDGTAAGTTLLKDVNPGSANGYPRSLTANDGSLYFRATDGGGRDELWCSDGTTTGTVLVKQLGTSFASLQSLPLISSDGMLYALAWASGGNQLWKSDGTTTGTTLITTVVRDPAASSGTRFWLTPDTNGVDFIGYDAASGSELWHTDGTAAGTLRLADIDPGTTSSAPANLLSSSLGVFFAAVDGTHGREIWKTDGTAAGTQMVKDVNTVTADSVYIAGFTAINGQVFFAADDSTHGTELWKTDGTAGGTLLVKDIKSGRGSSLSENSSDKQFAPIAWNGVLYFVADDGVNGRELWRSDGTGAGTYMVKDLWTGPISSYPKDLTVFNGAVYFTTFNSISRQLWRTDGTTAGTVLVKDNFYASDFAPMGGLLYFAGSEKTTLSSSPYGTELWATDGTTAGTTMIVDLNPGTSSGLFPSAGFVNVNGALFFAANDGTHGWELWKSDGTAAGTVLVKDANSGSSGGTSLSNHAVINGILYYGVSFGGSIALWHSDGTADGTYRVSNVFVDNSGAFTRNSFAVLNGILLFQGDDSTHGNELMRTDGTPAGTTQVKDIQNPDHYPYFGSMPALMEPFNGQVYFTADDWIHGREFWRTDGTTGGTVMININTFRLSPTSQYDLSAYPGEPTNINGTLYFSAEDGKTGREVWTMSVVPPAAALGPVSPTPRNAPVASIPITFNAAVTGFDLSDLSLTRDGTSVTLAGATLTTSDNITFTLGNLAGLTGVAGTYVLKFTASGSGVKDADQVAAVADASAAWVMDLTPPAVTDVVEIVPDPRNTPVTTVDVTFSEPIDAATLTAADVTLTRNGSVVTLSGLSATLVSASTYRVSWLGSFTAAEGAYVLTVAGAGVSDLAGNSGSGSASAAWTMDTTRPAVTDVVDVAPDPRRTPVASIDVRFSEAIDIATFSAADWSLTRNGSAVALSGLTVSALGGTAYRVSGLGGLTSAEGTYAITLSGAGINDPAGNAGTGSASDSWIVDTTSPLVAAIGPVTPDPRNTFVSTVDVTFSELIDASTFTTAALELMRDGTPVSLPSGVAISALGGAAYQINGLGPVTAAEGHYLLAVDATGVSDLVGNAGSGRESIAWVMDLSAPSAIDVVDVTPDPRNSPVASVAVTFSEPIELATIEASDLSLTRDGASVTLPAGLAVTLVAGSTYRIAGLGSVTMAEGSYTITIAGNSIADLAGNSGNGSASDSWVMDTTQATVTVTAVSPDLRDTPVSAINVQFSELIDSASSALDALSLTRDGVPIVLSGISIAPMGSLGYRLNGFDTFTTVDGAYVLAMDATRVADLAGNPGIGSATTTWTMDGTAPAVIIDEAADQPDPTSAAEIRFGVTFSEPVVGFDGTKVSLFGTAPGNLLASVAPGLGANEYVVTVTGMTGPGTVVTSVAPNAVVDLAGNGNLASTATDNVVEFDNAAPTVTVVRKAGQSDPTAIPAIVFDVGFNKPVFGFETGDVDVLGSTAPGNLVATVTGSGSDYVVTVTGMTAGGVVAASIPMAVARDLAGNGNAASSGSQNTVTYACSGTVQFAADVFHSTDPHNPVSIVITRSGGSEGPLDVQFKTVDGSAVAGTDFVATNGTIHWDAGDTSAKTFPVLVLDHGGFATDLAFGVVLSDVSLDGALGTATTATVAIHESAQFAFAAPTYTVTESDSTDHADVTQTISVRRLFGSAGAVSVNYSITGGTAEAGSDYLIAGATGTLTWVDGETADKSITITIRDDSISEGRETINLALSTPTGNGELGGQNTAVVTIAPSDGKPAGTTFSDADGDRITVKLGGRLGTLTYYLTNGFGPIAEIDLHGTYQTESVVALAIKKAQYGDGRVGIGEINSIGTAGAKSLSLGNADLIGNGIHLSSFVRALAIGNVRNGADILLDGVAPLAPKNLATRISLGVVDDGTDIRAMAPLRSLTAVRIGKGSITAPSIDTIAVKGKAKTKSTPVIIGNFNSDLTIAGTGLASTHVPALRSFNISGSVNGSTIQIGGLPGTFADVGLVKVGAFVNSRLFAGYSGSDDGSGTFNLPSTIGSFAVTGNTNAFAQSVVIASNFKNVALASVDPVKRGIKFGFVYRMSMKALAVKSTGFKFDAKGSDIQDMALSDFEVRKVGSLG